MSIKPVRMEAQLAVCLTARQQERPQDLIQQRGAARGAVVAVRLVRRGQDEILESPKDGMEHRVIPASPRDGGKGARRDECPLSTNLIV
jgi:hypothetical protein